MRIYCIAQGTLLNALWWPNGKKVQEGGVICIGMADSFCYTVETNMSFPSGSVSKQSPAMQDTLVWSLVWSPGGGNGNPFQNTALRIRWTEEPQSP